MRPFAARYGGHQFGSWAGQLGDGRAITLGEVEFRGERSELQLKGAGPTPYSRGSDGRAVLRSSVREFLCSEAMHHLGVPTTRALSLVKTGDRVVRDMFYDGHPKAEPGAIVCRVAPTFLRFGSYQILASSGEKQELSTLIDYTLRHFFAELGPPAEASYAAWAKEVAGRTAYVVAQWMAVGFVHGVMNTDNMSILGLTIDYGPYGWVDDFDLNFTPNTTDAAQRRYRFGAQPRIAAWNLARFLEAISPVFEDQTPLEEAMNAYEQSFERHWHEIAAKKLGLSAIPLGEDPLDPFGRAWLWSELQGLLSSVETDMTRFFRALADVPMDLEAREEQLLEPLRGAYYAPKDVPPEVTRRTVRWLRALARQVERDGVAKETRAAAMKRHNPKYVLRNYLAQLAIDEAERGDVTLLHQLLDCLQRPYDEQPTYEHFAIRRPDWARSRAGCSMLSCSS
jgi:uncharacterized protein YdiU (UPF0061 family)